MKTEFFTENELKLKNLFEVKFPPEFEIDGRLVRSISKPIFSDRGWKPITITFVDPIGEKTISKRLYSVIEKYQEKQKSGSSIVRHDKYIIEIITLDKAHKPLDKWIVSYQYIDNIDFGEMNHQKDKLSKITMTIRPLNCKFEQIQE